jgi:hypothetical protein
MAHSRKTRGRRSSKRRATLRRGKRRMSRKRGGVRNEACANVPPVLLNLRSELENINSDFDRAISDYNRRMTALEYSDLVNKVSNLRDDLGSGENCPLVYDDLLEFQNRVDAVKEKFEPYITT